MRNTRKKGVQRKGTRARKLKGGVTPEPPGPPVPPGPSGSSVPPGSSGPPVTPGSPGPSVVPTTDYVTCPLHNPNLLCYMNSSFQLLYSIPEIKTFFETITDAGIDGFKVVDEGTANPLAPDIDRYKNILKAVKDVFNRMKRSIDSDKSLVTYDTDTKLMPSLYGIDEGFKKGRQQDAADMIQGILTVLEHFRGDTRIKTLLDAFTYNPNEMYTCKDITVQVNPKEIHDTFVKLPINSLETKQHVNESDYDTIVKALSIGDKEEEYTAAFNELKGKFDCEVLSIQYLIGKYQEHEKIDEQNNKYESCKSTANPDGIATEKWITLTIPDTLSYILLQLKRFNHTFDKKQSVITKIKKPVEPSPEIEIDEKNFYLDGVIYHTGETYKDGHYIYVKYKDGKPHTSVSDSLIQTIDNTDDKKKIDITTLENEIKENGYIFLYKKESIVPVPPVLPVPPQ